MKHKDVMRPIRHGAYALAAGYMALLPQFSPVFSLESRFNLYWNHRFYAAIVTSVLIMALIFWAIFGIVRCLCPKPFLRIFIFGVSIIMWAIAFRCVIGIAAGAGYLEEEPWSCLNLRNVKIAYYLILPVALAMALRGRFVRALLSFYLAVSLVAVSMLTMAAFYETRDVSTLPPLEYAGGEYTDDLNNIYIFMFDEWSYQQTYPDGKLVSFMTNLVAFSERANVYHQAYAPGTITWVSIPKFIYQLDRELVSRTYAQVRDLSFARDLTASKSIFGAYINHYRAVLGFQVPYSHFIGNDIEYAGEVPVLAVGLGYRAWIRNLLASQYVFLNHFGVPVHRPEVFGQEGGAHRFNVLYDKSREIIETVDQPTYAFFHYSLPHSPFIWDREGFVHGKQNIRESTVENYQGNMRYLDRVIGEIIQLLKDTGKYESSLIVMTSDHSWRMDPAYVGENRSPAARHDRWREEQDKNPHSFLKHVPLIVKEPGQTKGKAVWEEMDLTDIYEKYISHLPR